MLKPINKNGFDQNTNLKFKVGQTIQLRFQIINQSKERTYQMQTETQKDLRIDLEKIIDQIIMEISSGIEITSENIDEWNNDGQYELGDRVSGFDYLENILDIEFRVNDKLEYRSAEILLARGEINIRIDTNAKKVFGEHEWDYYEAFYTKDTIDIDYACSEIFLNYLP